MFTPPHPVHLDEQEQDSTAPPPTPQNASTTAAVMLQAALFASTHYLPQNIYCSFSFFFFYKCFVAWVQLLLYIVISSAPGTYKSVRFLFSCGLSAFVSLVFFPLRAALLNMFCAITNYTCWVIHEVAARSRRGGLPLPHTQQLLHLRMAPHAVFIILEGSNSDPI